MWYQRSFLILSLAFACSAQADGPKVTVNPAPFTPHSPNISILFSAVPKDIGDNLESIKQTDKEAQILCSQIQRISKEKVFPFRGAIILFPSEDSKTPLSQSLPSQPDVTKSEPSSSLTPQSKPHKKDNSKSHPSAPESQKSGTSNTSPQPKEPSSDISQGDISQQPGWSYDATTQELKLEISDASVQTSADLFKESTSGDMVFTCVFGMTKPQQAAENFEVFGVQFGSDTTTWLPASKGGTTKTAS